MPAQRELIHAIRQELARRADPAKAPRMQAYMKSEMPYLGAAAPVVRAACKAVFPKYPLESFAEWHDTVAALWREATHREERYAATELAGSRPYRPHQVLQSLPLYEEMIVTGAWWDHVDAVAIHLVGPLLAAFAHPMAATMRQWSVSDDRWKRRSSIICQVSFKATTDLDLLYACIAPNQADADFFIRKAIGWALRAYAWVDPDEVIRYVKSQGGELSGLSRREALKNVPAGRMPSEI